MGMGQHTLHVKVMFTSTQIKMCVCVGGGGGGGLCFHNCLHCAEDHATIERKTGASTFYF